MAKADRKGAVHGSIRPKWFAPVAALLVFAAAGGLLLSYDSMNNTLAQPAERYGGAAAAVVALLLIFLIAQGSRREWNVDAKGVSLRVGFGKPTEIKWSEAHDYYYRAVTGSSTPSVEKASVQTPDGRRIDVDNTKLPGFPNATIAGLVERYSAAATLPKITERIEAGEEVQFGPVTVENGKLIIADSEHSVDEGLVLHIKQDRLQVGVDGDWIATKVSVHEVPNYPCLLRVIGQLTQARPPA